jgi:BhlA holin family
VGSLEFTEYIKYFLTSETPFALLFVSLFFYTVKSNKEREANMNAIIEKRLTAMQSDMKVMMKVWKVLLEKELNKQEDKK